VRDLLPQQRAESNLIEFCRELVYTNNAGPQWDATSPVPHQEGAPKNESGITFELANQAVTTLAHWIPASRQVLKDAKMLQGYIEGRLTYGLKLEEEDELLNGTNLSGELNGLRTQQTAFNGGVTNQTALDTLLKAFLQISLSEYEATGVVLHPTDWTNILLLKDTQGRYLFSDPHGQTSPQVWGKPVVATQSMTQGQFLAGALALAAEIFDSEDATVRVAEQHQDFFIKNMVAILAEERLALVVYRPTAIVGGAISYAG
jgi:HK97 family phage major capsid protein